MHEASGCDEVFPVIGGVPRLLLGPHRSLLAGRHASWFASSAPRRALGARWTGDAGPDETARIVLGFDFEWRHFREVDGESIARVFGLYFDLLEPERFAPSSIVLDAGCGGGRWAYQVAQRGPRVVAVDLGESVEVAHESTRSLGTVACVQADLADLPLRTATIDWAYSLGVLHHMTRPDDALARIAGAVRPGGAVLLYLYYALDGRGWAFRALFRAVDLARRVVSASPRPLALGFAACFAALVYWPLARLARVTRALGLRSLSARLPLTFYADTSFRIMLNDSLDRFGTRLERRYTQSDMRDLMSRAGLSAIRFSSGPPYWHAVALREALPEAVPGR